MATRFLEFFAIALRHAVPLFGLSPVRVVDGVKHQVLVVPTERGVLHADVEPGNVDPTNVMLARKLHQTVALNRNVV